MRQHAAVRCAGWAFVLCLWLLPETVLAQGHAPAIAAGKMTIAEGLEVQLLAAEPLIKQPVCIEFDDRGRLWVIQYLQYPNPAGLVRTKVDRFSRTLYDKVPEPPPLGPRGADRITILEDTNGDGVVDQGRDFIDGLNLATGLAFGHGGVYVLQVPYLLFYPDKNRDDVPDGPPEVCVTGFGMEDAHSVANSLTWGPDGWLYGCQGSTVTAKINGIEFQQGVWRYHPVTKKFELHCEGGGNSWGLDFDRTGRLLYSTNHGGHRLLHALPGAYYWKSFGKHGALHNPYAYGYFDHAPHTGYTGGHVTVAGIVYRGDALPAAYRDQFLNVDTLGHGLLSNTISPYGSTVKTAQGPALLMGNDTWFAPCDLTVGPDGALYFSDWHDARMAHPDPDAEWDRTNGRIYRLATKGHPTAPACDLQQKTTAELIALHDTPNDWYIRRARRVLAERQDPAALPVLRQLVEQAAEHPQRALEALWTLYQCGGLDNALSEQLLQHPQSVFRRVAVQLWGEQDPAATNLDAAVHQMLQTETDSSVLCQLACSVRRKTTPNNWEFVVSLAQRDDLLDDPFYPLLVWWAFETEFTRTREPQLLSWTEEDIAPSRMWTQQIVPRLIRRLAQGNSEDIRLASSHFPALDGASLAVNRKAFLQGLQERSTPLPAFDFNEPTIHSQLVSEWDQHPKSLTELAIMLRLRYRPAIAFTQQQLETNTLPLSDQVSLIALWSQVAQQEVATQRLLTWFKDPQKPEVIRRASLQALQSLKTPTLGEGLVGLYPRTQSPWRHELAQILLSRPQWATLFLAEFSSGKLLATELKVEDWQTIISELSPEDKQAVIKLWGNVSPPTPEERLAEIRRLNNDLRAGAGQVHAGQLVFAKHCAVCHQLAGQGAKVGPDLTHVNRADKDYLLLQLVDPNAIIRKEFLAYTVVTTAGQTVSGLIAEQTPASLTLIAAKAEKTVIPMSDIEELRESTTSLMPENILKQLPPQELRDLFAYLQAQPAGQ